MVRHCDIEGRTVHVFGERSTTDRAVVARAAIGGPEDQRLAKPVAQGQQLVESIGVDLDRTGAAASNFCGRKVGPAPCAFGNIEVVPIPWTGSGVF
jgi:hypothetical protein